MSASPSRVVQDFAALPPAAVSDALDRLGIRGHCKGVKALDPRSKLCGRAFTVSFLPVGPADCRTPNGSLDAYLEDVPPGYVAVLDNRGHLDAAVWDKLLTRGAREQGIAGAVIDGACRESDTAAGTPWPVFACGTSARSAQDRVRVEACNLPVAIGGVRVECDDIVIADQDGVIVVPRERVGAVLEAAREIAAARA